MVQRPVLLLLSLCVCVCVYVCVSRADFSKFIFILFPNISNMKKSKIPFYSSFCFFHVCLKAMFIMPSFCICWHRHWCYTRRAHRDDQEPHVCWFATWQSLCAWSAWHGTCGRCVSVYVCVCECVHACMHVFMCVPVCLSVLVCECLLVLV